MNVLFYCQHSLGLGHFMRTMRIAQAVSRGAQVRVIAGGIINDNFASFDGVEVLRLPPLSMTPDGTLVNPSDDGEVSGIKHRRIEQVRNIVTQLRPDVLVIEMYPFGRKKFGEEITTLIETCRTKSNVRVICSVRDILVSRGEKQEAFDRRAVDTLNRYFDALLIHADPSFMRLNDSFTLFNEIRIPHHYTGYVANNGQRSRRNHHEAQITTREPRLVISSGGGTVGKRLAKVGMKAARRLYREHRLETLILSGALAKEPIDHAGHPSFLVVRQFVNNFAELLSSSQISVSQCGYNTATDIFATRTPSVFVPFETESEDEQLRRARCLEAARIGVTLREKNLTVESLVKSVTKALALRDQRVNVDTNGVKRSCELILGGTARAVA